METLTQEVMRHRISRIGSHRTAHRRPIEPATINLPPTHPCPEPEPQVVRESPLPHFLWIVGVFAVTLAAGVALGVALAGRLG